MKFTKILASLLALIAVLTMFAGCDMGNGGEETGNILDSDGETQKIFQHKRLNYPYLPL